MTVQIKDVDRKYYEEKLKGFLPPRLIDFHTHIWLKDFRKGTQVINRGQNWPLLVAEESPIEELVETYELMFPDNEITPVIFGWPERDVILNDTNRYVSETSGEKHFPALIVCTPDWSAEELTERVSHGHFLGLKPYLSWAPKEMPSGEITIYDFLPKAHLEAADREGWIVLLHIPRSARLKDPVNLKHLLEIEENYPNLKLVIAHLGRAYCAEDVGNAMEVLGKTRNMVFDISANTNEVVIQAALEAFGPQRLVFGSDFPIVRMRMRRICENGVYINLVPPGVYGDLTGDAHMREVSEKEAEELSFFVYENMYAFRKAAEKIGLTPKDVEDVFYNNAIQILSSVGWTI
jgi:predicted TIM-barrel fold metal-dependent hydrolase